MRIDAFKIYVDQLKDGQVEEIDESFPAAFLDVNEEELKFQDPVHVSGQVYLAEDDLILHLDIEATALIPCSICNEVVTVPLHIEDFYYAEPLAEIKSGLYDYSETLREVILLDVPQFAECQGNCSKRKEFKKYLREPTSTSEKEEGYQPFKDLEL